MKTPKLFFAPRSNEQSRENFLSTLENGYPYEDVKGFLTKEEQEKFKNKRLLYIWGNQPAKKGSWNNMTEGDFVAIYAHKEFIYVGNCVYKKHSPDLAKYLWGNTPGKDTTWEYTFFLDEIRPIKIPLTEIIQLAGYKENMVVQGFMPINEEGLKNIYKTYGSLEALFDSFTAGLRGQDFIKIDRTSTKEQLSGQDLEDLDKVFRSRDFDLILKEYEQRLGDVAPEIVNRKVTKVKRNQSLVKMMKERYGNECQVCGFTFEKKNGGYYSEVAHIRPIHLAKKGLDTPSNMVVLCPNHHKMLDLGKLQVVSRKSYSIEGAEFNFKKPLFE